jgi:dTDP-4-amino-4,6-dideoxygalactose transaminase
MQSFKAAKGMNLPFNKPHLADGEMEYLAQAMKNKLTASEGPLTRVCKNLLSSATRSPGALLTTVRECLASQFQPGSRKRQVEDQFQSPCYYHIALPWLS